MKDYRQGGEVTSRKDAKKNRQLCKESYRNLKHSLVKERTCKKGVNVHRKAVISKIGGRKKKIWSASF